MTHAQLYIVRACKRTQEKRVESLRLPDRPIPPGKAWISFEPRGPSTLTTTLSRPATAEAAVAARNRTMFSAHGSWDGEDKAIRRVEKDGDETTVQLYTHTGVSKGSSTEDTDFTSFASLSAVQQKGLFGKKASPMTIARSARFVPRWAWAQTVGGYLAQRRTVIQ